MKRSEAIKIFQDYTARKTISAFYQGLETDDPVFVMAVRRVLRDDGHAGSEAEVLYREQ